ncbi:MAG: copper resistance protein B [Pseudomonadales bacterium]|nr:copper resistance protein B [Pseudomonadales bacterium]
MALFYQQALDANWDLLAGFTTDIKPAPGRHWLSVGLKGLAPWFLETRSVLHFGEAGRVALNVEIEKEILLTQDWMLLPGLELNVYAQNDFATGHGSGISDAVLGLYMVRRANRKLMPYIGIQESRKFGKTAEYALKNGDIVSDTQWLIGVKAWY